MTSRTGTARPIVRVHAVNHYFGSGEARSQVLFDNHLEVMPGELVILSGPSGSGKTTLLTLIGGLRTLQEGTIEVWDPAADAYCSLKGMDEKGLVHVRRLIGFIFQRHNLFESLTAVQNVRMAQQLKVSAVNGTDPAITLLTQLGLGERVHYKPQSLSGGQRQRVAVARALVHGPGLILADEPTAALDEKSGEAVIGLLRQLAREHGCTSLIVTHDARIMNDADRIVDMQRGHIASNIVVAERLFVYGALRQCAAFSALLPQEQFRIADRILIGLHPDQPLPADRQGVPPAFETHPVGTDVVRQGEVGDKFYLIRRGRVEVIVDDPVTGPRKVVELDKGDFFGDRALLTGEPRNATVRAIEPLEVYTIGREDFQRSREVSIPFIETVLDVYGRNRGLLKH
jgi:putative ABC transport system ATP-binding protein